MAPCAMFKAIKEDRLKIILVIVIYSRNSFFFSRACFSFIVFLRRIGYFVNFFIVLSSLYLNNCYDLLLHYIVNDIFLYFWEYKNQNLDGILKN